MSPSDPLPVEPARLRAPAGRSGLVLFGSYRRFEPGRYYVVFQVLAEAEPVGPPDELIAVADVSVGYGARILATANIFRDRSMRTGGRIELPFALAEPEVLELRVWSAGRAALRIDAEPAVQRDDAGAATLAPLFPVGEAVEDAFARAHLEHLRHAFERGVDFSLHGDHASCLIDGVRLELRGPEDFQVLDEVFLKRDYRCRPGRDHIVIDVGMNVGFASLGFAADSAVRHVHAFEPFGRPYRQALRNIAANPRLADKISPNAMGLSDRDEELDVRSVEGFSLGMTLAGLDRGEVETIRIRDAAGVLGPILAQARTEGLGVVVKLDCEGSEFAILDSLQRAGLLQAVDAFMIEWHKEWRPELSQEDLIAPLNDNGFVVFDQTEAAGKIAGMLYAVRR